MSYRFIALLGEEESAARAGTHGERDTVAHEIGMDRVLASSRSALYVAKETPFFLVPGHGAIVGRLFSNDGAPIDHYRAIPPCSSGTQLEAYLLSNCWGEYVLLHEDGNDPGEFRAMRDPSGAMTCVHSIRQGRGFIASDVTLPMRLGRFRKNVDWDHLPHILSYPFLRIERTGLVDLRELLPGCVLIVEGTSARTEAVWSPWKYVAPPSRHSDLSSAIAEIHRAVSCVVKAYADTDRSTLLELSGGLDSSIVASCLLGSGASIQCGTLVMPTAGTDERIYASDVATRLGLDLQSVPVFFQDSHYEFPLPPEHTLPLIGILQHAINLAWERAADRLGATGFLSGGGGDTVFGYLKGASPAADAFQERGIGAGLAAIRNLSILHQCTMWKAARLTARKLARGPKAAWLRDDVLLDASKLPRYPDPHPWFNPPPRTLSGDREKVFDLIGAHSYKECTPRGSHRVVRFPLVAQPVLQACLKVPTWMWISEGRDRYVARKAFSDALPERVLNRRGKGTYANYCGAVYERKKAGMRAFLSDGLLRSRGLLDIVALETFIATSLAPRDMSFMRIFDLCMVENWARQQS